jgi:hypothetical protein
MIMILISIGIALVSFFNILIAIFVAENIEPYDPILWVCVALLINSLLIYMIAR